MLLAAQFLDKGGYSTINIPEAIHDVVARSVVYIGEVLWTSVPKTEETAVERGQEQIKPRNYCQADARFWWAMHLPSE